MWTHLILDGVADSSLGVGLDIVASAARLVESGVAKVPEGERPLRQRVVSIDGEPVRSGTGRSHTVDGALSMRAVGPGDVLVVPGVFGATGRSMAHFVARDDVKAASGMLAKAAARGAMVVASCSATFVLAASGALDGRRATTTWWLANAFRKHFPAVTLDADRMVVEDGAVLTAGSALAHADVMLAALARRCGPDTARLVMRYLVLDERESQARYMVTEHLRVSDESIVRVERFIAQNLGRQLSLDELAHAAALSPRTLARRLHAALGMTPHALVQRMRVARATHLLDTTRESVESIAARVGYADAAAFRRVFRRYAGQAPGAQRRR